jgi:hypothetical protein
MHAPSGPFRDASRSFARPMRDEITLLKLAGGA